MNAIVQFCYTLGLLLEGGVNLAESLDIVVKIIDNRVLAQALSDARDKIIKQGKISQYLKQTDIFPPIAIYLINTGEQSGQLDKMLLTVAQNYEEDLAEWADQTYRIDRTCFIDLYECNCWFYYFINCIANDTVDANYNNIGVNYENICSPCTSGIFPD